MVGGAAAGRLVSGLEVICLFGVEQEQDLVGRDEVVQKEVEDVRDFVVLGRRLVGMMLARTFAMHFF